VTPEFVREMEAAGLRHPTPDELVTMRIHDVNADFVDKLKAAGFSGLSIDQLVSFKIHGVDPARLAEMQKLWGKLSPDQVVTLQIHDVTPEYASQMKGSNGRTQVRGTRFHENSRFDAGVRAKTRAIGLNLDQLVRS
jgi:hypothetical protein